MTKLSKALHKIYSPSGKGLGEKGFTLVELLVVVAILGAIATVVTLNVAGFIGRGVCEGYCTEKHNIQTAVVAAMAEGQAATWANAQTYLIGDTDYTWSSSVGSDGTVTDASDKPTSDNCSCFD
ncbi:MAG TPA: prepilin-type N-terminal cleavage/methylation domain-containing protein [Dehalococcoidia bacterium]|nr:prepilin-type N-terminal cleavage/methylation domain-containing protein [Dehalococcoidia bacterium]